MKNTKTAMKELTAMYRSVLLKCLAIAAGVMIATGAQAQTAAVDVTYNRGSSTLDPSSDAATNVQTALDILNGNKNQSGSVLSMINGNASLSTFKVGEEGQIGTEIQQNRDVLEDIAPLVDGSVYDYGTGSYTKTGEKLKAKGTDGNTATNLVNAVNAASNTNDMQQQAITYLENRVVELATADTNEGIARADGDKALQNQINTLNGADTVDGSVANTVKTQAANATYTDANNNTTTLGSALLNAEKDIDALQNTTQLNSNAIATLTATDTALGGRIDGVVSNVSDLSGKVSQLEAADTVQDGKIEAAQEDIADLEKIVGTGAITAENAAGTAYGDLTQAVNGLDKEITAEATARENADNQLQENIDAEALARAKADETLQKNIDAEATTRENADKALQENINALADGAVATNTAAIGTLNNLETDAKTDLVSAINEVNKNADTNAAAIAQEITDRANADKTLQGNIEAEATARAEADETLQKNIDAEKDARINADTALNEAIVAETKEREAADTALQASIDTLNGDETVNGSVANTVKTQAEKADYTGTQVNGATGTTSIGDALSATATQVNTNTEAIGTLSGLTTDAKDNLVNALNEVDANTDANTQAIATLNGDADVAGSVANSIKTQAANADYTDVNGVATNIGAALGAAETDIDNLQKVVGDGTITAGNADGTYGDLTTAVNGLDQEITDEAAARAEADKTLQGNIDTEVTARKDADATLLNYINGGEYDTNGSIIHETPLGVVNHATGTAYSNLTAAVNGLDGEIGGPVTSVYNGVSSSNTINQNIDAINNTLGDIAGLQEKTLGNLAQAGGIATLADVDDTGTEEIPEPDLPEADAPTPDVGDDTTTDSPSDAVTPPPAVAQTPTVADHLSALDASIGDRRDLGSANAAINQAAQVSVAEALKATGNAIGDMNFSGTKYLRRSTSVTSALQALDRNLGRLDSKVNELDKEMRGGFASMAALSALQPNARAENDTQVSIGTGMYRDQVGGAIGVFHYLNDNTMLNAGVSFGGSDAFMGRAGATFGW